MRRGRPEPRHLLRHELISPQSPSKPESLGPSGFSISPAQIINRPFSLPV